MCRLRSLGKFKIALWLTTKFRIGKVSDRRLSWEDRQFDSPCYLQTYDERSSFIRKKQNFESHEVTDAIDTCTVRGGGKPPEKRCALNMPLACKKNNVSTNYILLGKRLNDIRTRHFGVRLHLVTRQVSQLHMLVDRFVLRGELSRAYTAQPSEHHRLG